MKTVYSPRYRKHDSDYREEVVWKCEDADEPSPDDWDCGKKFKIIYSRWRESIGGGLWDGDVDCPYCGEEIDVT